jgi:hypothetical protein
LRRALVAVTCSSSGESSLFLKFLLDICTPSGFVACVTQFLADPFTFVLRNVYISSVTTISSNASGIYNSSEMVARSRYSCPALSHLG